MSHKHQWEEMTDREKAIRLRPGERTLTCCPWWQCVGCTMVVHGKGEPDEDE